VSGRSPRVLLLLVVVLGGGALLGLSGCGDPSAAPTVSTIAVTSTAYVTIPARTTTSTIATVPNESGNGDNGDPADSESSVVDDPAQERVYEIQAGDTLVGIATDFDLPVDYLPEYNGWTDGLRHSLMPGQEMRIPPSDWDPDGTAPDASTDATDGSAPDATTDAECADGEQPETYEIQPGDIPASVAEDHGVSVQALEAANEDTPYYAGFVVGITINIPC